MMLLSPISARAAAPLDADRPLFVRTDGRCVARNASWKPQAAKPAFSIQKPGCVIAVRSISCDRTGSAADVAAAVGSFEAMANSGIDAARLASTINAHRHPVVVIKPSVRGTSVNMPTEPAVE